MRGRAASRAAAAGAALLLLAVGTGGVAALVAWPVLRGEPSRLVVVVGDSMRPTLVPGDLVVVWPEDRYDPGDVVVYPVRIGGGSQRGLVVHRVVGAGPSGYVTRGDNKDHADPWRAAAGDVVGRQVLRVPHAGTAAALLGQPGVLAALAAGLVTFVAAAGPRRGDRPSLHWELPDGTEQPVAGAYSGVV